MCIAAVVSYIQNVGGRHRDRLLLSIEVNNRVNIQYATADFVMELCISGDTYLIFQLHF